MLNDTEKRYFYVSTTSVIDKVRCRKAANPNRKKSSVSYFFNKSVDEPVRVCKEFYLCTLDIDEKRVRNAHRYRDELTGQPSPYVRGKAKTRAVSSFIENSIRRHIDSIPRIESHYCRKETNKQYIDGNLNITKLYEMYCERCTEELIVPAKLHKYRQVFNTEYNISFHHPKKDRCDICEIYDKNVNRTTEDTEKYQQHRLGKLETKEEKLLS